MVLFFFISVHPCDQGANAGCEQVCNKKGDDPLCGCNDGFKVSEEDQTKCEKSKSFFTGQAEKR